MLRNHLIIIGENWAATDLAARIMVPFSMTLVGLAITSFKVLGFVPCSMASANLAMITLMLLNLAAYSRKALELRLLLKLVKLLMNSNALRSRSTSSLSWLSLHVGRDWT
jgi:hypothetical protein